MRRTRSAGFAGAVGLMMLALYVCPRDSGLRAQDGVQPKSGRTFETQFWTYLRAVHYRNWAPPPGQGLQFRSTKSPHGPHVKLYLNRTAIADSKKLPLGSIIIKENYDKSKKTLTSITAMYRVKDFDPEHNDWYWVKYDLEGNRGVVAKSKAGKPLSGRVKSCIDCHSAAKGGDYYFANDK